MVAPDRDPDRGSSIEALTERFVAAWHGGEAPDVDAYLSLAAEGDRDELLDLLSAFLLLAPTVEPTAERAQELAGDPLVQRVGGLAG